MRVHLFGIAILIALTPAWVIGQNAKKITTDIRGPIAKITPANAIAKKNGILATIFVDGNRQPDTAYDKAHIKITKQTKLWKFQNDKRVAATVADLRKAMQVEVRFTGPVLESYPVQATAGTVRILAAPAKKP